MLRSTSTRIGARVLLNFHSNFILRQNDVFKSSNHLMSSTPPSKKEKLVVLHDVDGKIIRNYFISEAEAIAKKRGLVLQAIESNTKLPSVKLVKLGEEKEESLKVLQSIVEAKPGDKPVEKKLKQLRLHSKMSDHDLELKAQQVIKFILDGRIVRVQILGKENHKAFENIFKKFEIAVGNSVELKQKQISPNGLYFMAMANPKFEADVKNDEKTTDSKKTLDELEATEKINEELQKEVEALVKGKMKEK